MKECFQNFIDHLHITKETIVTVENKSLTLVFPLVGSNPGRLGLNWRRHVIKSHSMFLEITLVLRNKLRLGEACQFKDLIPNYLTSVFT